MQCNDQAHKDIITRLTVKILWNDLAKQCFPTLTISVVTMVLWSTV